MRTNRHVVVGPTGYLKAYELVASSDGIGMQCEWCADERDAYGFTKLHEAKALLDENRSLRGCWLDKHSITLEEKLVASKIKEHDATQWTGIKDQIQTFLRGTYGFDIQELRGIFRVREEIRRQMEKLNMEVIYTEKKTEEAPKADEPKVEETDGCEGSCGSDGCDDCPLDGENEATELEIDRKTVRVTLEAHPGLWNLGFRSALMVDGHIEEAYKEEKIPDFKIKVINDVKYIELPEEYYTIEDDESIISIVHDKDVADKYAEANGYTVVAHEALTEEDF